MQMQTRLSVTMDEGLYAKLIDRAVALRISVELLASRLLKQASDLLPVTGRAVVVSGDELARLESILGGGSLLHGGDLTQKVERLAGISFLHQRLPFTPNQLEALAEKASRQGLTVEQLVDRTAPRIYEQFFDLIARV